MERLGPVYDWSPEGHPPNLHPLHSRGRREEGRFLPHQVGIECSKRRDVIDNPDTAPVCAGYIVKSVDRQLPFRSLPRPQIDAASG